MSRIDEALKALDREAGTRGVTQADPAAHGSYAATLDVYPGEMPAPAVPAPHDHTIDRRKGSPLAPNAPAPTLRPADPESRVINRATPSMLVEQYRRLAAALHDAQVERSVKTVMITSAVPREGKTLTSVNLALTLSESYARRVLLVDADLRRPSIHDVLGISNTRGLGDALRDPALQVPVVELSANLSVLPAGRTGSTPLAGLTSERMGHLLDEFEKRFDWVLIDTPPVGFLPDAQLLARLIQAVVFVIGARATPAPVIERAVAALGTECILGTVLNRVDEGQTPDAGYYYGGYGDDREPSVTS